MKLTRKEFLKSATTALSVAGLGATMPSLAAADPSNEPPAGFTDSVVRGLPPVDQIWDWEKRLAAFAPAFTGSSRHNDYINMLDAGLKESGYETHRQTLKLPYWEPHAYGLTVGTEKVHVPGYRPYSGPTGPKGVKGALVYAGSGDNLDFSSARGKIALIDVPYVGDGFYKDNDVIATVPLNMEASFQGDRASACISGMRAPNLDGAVKAGATGVIYVWNVSDGNAQDQVQPFFAPPTPVPAIWVGHATGERLKAEVAKGTEVTLTMHATVHPDTPSDTLWTYLPGATDDVIIVNTHTDGCNACEENGGIAVMSMAKAIAKIPQEKRQKSYVFLFTTGHFAHGYFHGAPEWQAANPELMKKAVACMTIEHLGAIDYHDDAKGNYISTGQPQWGRIYTPRAPLSQVLIKAAAATKADHMVVIHPHDRYYGEGLPFWKAGVPTLSYIVVPEYLMAAPPKDGEIGRLSRRRMHTEIITLARCLELMDKGSRSQLWG